MSVASHYDESAATYADQYNEAKLWTNAEYPANFFRLRLVLRLLAASGARSVYEVGAGDATPLIEIAKSGVRVAGSDLSNEMVRHARAHLTAAGLDPDVFAQVDVEDESAVALESERVGAFDTAMALGVIPHVVDDRAFISTMDRFIKPGGQLLLQFRNAMFAMFTFNRMTKEFILNDLLADVPEGIKAVVERDLDQRLDVNQPPKRTRPTGDGYDEILSRFHNPFELADLVREAGFNEVRFHWYNVHPAYPMLTREIDARVFREAQMDLEGDLGWRGMFLCSAGIIEATKRSG